MIETIETTLPDTDLTEDTDNKDLRHIVARLTPFGVVPAKYSTTALCGEKVTELHLEHGTDICQDCVDIMSKVPREPHG